MDKEPRRDLYADLELAGPTEDIDLVRKQYRKLSLKKHPDRPGGSNEAFNIINHAHAVLTDPEKKRKYDAEARRTRAAYASGVRGNPWANAGKEWAPPPRPPNFPQRPAPSAQKRQSASTNADKYAEFTAGAPRRTQAKKTDSTNTWQHWQAWEDMRNGSKGKAAARGPGASGASSRTASTSRPSSYQQQQQQQQPPPVPPRAPPQKQPKGSFGARVQRGGYVPESPGDEPAVSGNNYFTTRSHSNLFNETSSAARARRRAPSNPGPDSNRDSTFMDPRQSTPYQTHGGEKFDPWNGASNIGRSRSTREPNRRPYNDDENEPSAASPRQRSSSVPDDSDDVPRGERSERAGRNGQRSSGTTSASSDYRSSPEGTRDGAGDGSKNSSKLYGDQSHSKSAPPQHRHEVPQQAQQATGRAGDGDFCSKKNPPNQRPSEPEVPRTQQHPGSSSEDNPPPQRVGLNAFEQKMSQLLRQLSARKYGHQRQEKQARPAQDGTQPLPVNPPPVRDSADLANFNTSFGSQFTGEQFVADSHRFTRNSTDNINTRFVAEEDATSWQFNAGSPVDEAGRPAMPRSKSGSRLGHKSPFATTDGSQQPRFTGPPVGEKSPHSSAFNPEEWSEKISRQIFEAPVAHKTSVAGGRTNRNPSKKPKPVRMTAGTAGMVESDESSSGLDELPKGPAAAGRGPSVDGTPSPMAMDVDPPAGQSDGNGARNIPVTPSRPEWRAGDVGLGIKGDAKPPPQPSFAPAAGGSEDSEEFRASFSDIRNVEPFAERASGLESFGDLKSNLPFPSAAAGHVPMRKPVSRSQNIQEALPEPPKPPNPPPALAVPGLKPSPAAWKQYVETFYTYLGEFHAYNTKFIDHFSARRVQVHQKLGTAAWLELRDGAGIQEYMTWAEEDREVRKKWTDACDEHELNVRLFTAHREKMMK